MAWLSGYTLRKKLTVQSANVDSDMTAFPVYVYINADADLHEARSDGYDIRFTQSDGETLLKYEREYWTGGNGSAATAHFWVKSNLTAASGATIYMYYGDASASDGDDKNNVWDSDFWGVWHCADATVSTIADSTSNGRTGTKKGDNEPVEATGKIYKAQSFDGSDDYIETASISPSGISGMTLGLWEKTSAGDTGGAVLAVWGDWRGTTRDAITALKANFVADGGSAGSAETTSDINSGTWNHIVGTSTSNAQVIYFNGASQDTATETLDTSHNDGGFLFGANSAHTWLSVLDLCEVRLSDIARSAAWVKFEHANINEGDNELTWSSEQQAYSLTVDAGSYDVTGTATSLIMDRNVAVAAGSYTVSGQAVSLLMDRTLGVDAGAYAWSGKGVNLWYPVFPAGGGEYFLKLNMRL